MAAHLDAWQASVAAVRDFVGEQKWPQDYDSERWARAAAALDLDRPRPCIVVMRAGDGCFAACVAHRCAATTVALLDDRYFGGAGRDSIEAPDHLDALSSKLIARRDGAGSTARRALRGLFEPGAALVAVDALEGLTAVRAVRLFCAAPVERIVVESVAPAAAAKLHGRGHRSYAPDAQAFGIGAKFLGEDVVAWRDALRGVCATQGTVVTDGLDLAYAKPVKEGAVDLNAPLLRNVADELAALKRRIDRRIIALPPTQLADGAAALLKPSTADHFVDGGYAGQHYVPTPPDRNEACFEMRIDGVPCGFVSIGATSFGGPRTSDGGWPWAGEARVFDCATVSRLVLLDAARGRGALAALLRACDAFHAEGLPCRVTTRKRAVAERALGVSPVLAADEGARAKRRAAAATNLDAAQRAMVPYAFDAFRASTPAAPRERGHNGSWTFWYRGAPVVRPVTGGRYAYVGGAARFSLCV